MSMLGPKAKKRIWIMVELLVILLIIFGMNQAYKTRYTSTYKALQECNEYIQKFKVMYEDALSSTTGPAFDIPKLNITFLPTS